MQGFATNPFACRLFATCLHLRAVASLLALGIEHYWLFPVLLHRTFSSLLLPVSLIHLVSIDMEGMATTLIPRGAIAIPICRKYPISYWNRLKEPGCIRRTKFFWISSSSCGRTSQLDRRSLFAALPTREPLRDRITSWRMSNDSIRNFWSKNSFFGVSIFTRLLVTEFCQGIEIEPIRRRTRFYLLP